MIMAKGKEARRGKEKEEKKPVAAAPAPKAEVKPVAAAAPEPPKEEKKKEKKSQKERPKSKKKHTNVQVWKLYEVKGNQLVRKNEPCPRCGAGTFLAVYKGRKYCGKCGWSQLPKTEEKK
jgi:small subunit ribosomal protein S27Ae